MKSLAFVNSSIQKVNLFIRYFSLKFNCRAMPLWKSDEFSYLSVIHNEKISAMNLFNSRGLVLLRFSISVSTADTKGTLACMQAFSLSTQFAPESAMLKLPEERRRWGESKGAGRGRGDGREKRLPENTVKMRNTP